MIEDGDGLAVRGEVDPPEDQPLAGLDALTLDPPEPAVGVPDRDLDPLGLVVVIDEKDRRLAVERPDRLDGYVDPFGRGPCAKLDGDEVTRPEQPVIAGVL